MNNKHAYLETSRIGDRDKIAITIDAIRTFPSHFHDDIEILFIWEGSVRVTLNGKEAMVCAGDMLTVLPGTSHKYEELETTHSILLLFSPGILASITELPAKLQYQFKNNILNDKIMNGKANCIFQAIIENMNREFGYQIVYGLIHILFSEILFYSEVIHEKEKESALLIRSPIEQIILFIDQHYLEPITLDTIARQFHLTSSYLSRMFHQQTQIKLKEYILMRRIEYSIDLLYKTNYNFLQIALESGFNSQSAYTRSFKKYTGITPMDFKKNKDWWSGNREKDSHYSSLKFKSLLSAK